MNIRSGCTLEHTGAAPAACSHNLPKACLMSSSPPFDWATWSAELYDPGVHEHYGYHEVTSNEFAFINELWPLLLTSPADMYDTR
jgi:hypothetical protein